MAARTRALKVYSWYSSAPQSARQHGRPRAAQVRCIVAAPSLRAVKKEICGQPGGVRWPGREYISETGNAESLRTALAKPGTVFWQWLDYPPGPWKAWIPSRKEQT